MEAETRLINWYALFNFIGFLYTEDIIKNQTYNEMIDKLMTFKNYAYEFLEGEENE